MGNVKRLGAVAVVVGLLATAGSVYAVSPPP